MWGGDGASGGDFPDDAGEHASLVAQVKEIGRQSPVSKQQWCAYCNTSGSGKYDPALHTVDFLKAFVAQHNSGAPLPVASPESEIPFGEFTKAMQRRSQVFKNAYVNYCNQYGGGRFDPMRHEASFLLGFYEYLAQCTLTQSTPPTMDVVNGPAAKRIRTGLAPPSMGGPVPPAGVKEQIVEAIKAFGREAKENKEAWCLYADTYLGGTRDPARHEVSVLQEFCSHYKVAVGYGGGGGGFGARVPPRASSAPPTVVPATSYGAVASGGSKDIWVNKLKAFQRSSEQNKELWNLYSDTYLGGIRDPNRHATTVLQEFCRNHDVDSAIGNVGISRVVGAGLIVVAPRKAPPAPIGYGGSAAAPYGGSGGSWVGAAAGYGGAGSGYSASDPTKDKLVQAVKAFQRSGEGNSEAWGRYADMHLGGMRDPGRHDAVVLQEFCAAHGVDTSGGGSSASAGASAAEDPVKADLVQRVKNYQRGGPQQKEAWATFAGVTLDPSRHTVEMLSEFVQTHCST